MKEFSIEECEEGLKSIYSNMPYPRQIGAIPEEQWNKFLEGHLKENGDLYVPEQVLRIIEQLAVNNDINSALKIYDSMQISLTDFDEVTKIIEEHFPIMGNQSQALLGKTYNEFLVRANSDASFERTHFANKKQPISKNDSKQNTSLIQATTIEECEESLKLIYSNMAYPRQIGAIPEEQWNKFLEEHLKENGNLYVPEQVLKIIEQLAVNNNVDNALALYDSINSSYEYGLVCDKDDLTSIIKEHFPTMGTQTQVLLSETYNEFFVRANSKASYERTHFLRKETPQILPSQAAKNALKTGTTSEKVYEANNIESAEQNLEKNNEGVTKDD